MHIYQSLTKHRKISQCISTRADAWIYLKVIMITFVAGLILGVFATTLVMSHNYLSFQGTTKQSSNKPAAADPHLSPFYYSDPE